jgi:protein SCO1
MPVCAGPGLPGVLKDVGFEQKLDAQAPLDTIFRDETGTTVTLADYFDGKPVILVLAYGRCPMLCNQVLNGLVRAMMDLPFDAGKEYRVVTVSIDPHETPDMAAAKKQTYFDRYGRAGAAAGWRFLTGDEEQIKRLADAVGFRYTYDARNDQYAHASGIMLLTPTGKMARYFFDVHFSPRDLRLGLVEASEGRIGSATDQILLYCFRYDPTEGKYGPIIINLVRLGGILTVLGIGTFFGGMWWRERRRLKTAPEG